MQFFNWCYFVLQIKVYCRHNKGSHETSATRQISSSDRRKTPKELIHVEERNDLIVLKPVLNLMNSLMHDLR